MNDNDELTLARPRAQAAAAPRRNASAAHRLVREGLISTAEYARVFAAEAADWANVMGMDEAALDAELGSQEAAAIDALAGRARPAGRRGPPILRLAAQSDRYRRTVPYREHYRIRLAGVKDGLMGSAAELRAEIREVRRLLMTSPEFYMPDVFHALESYLGDGRLLVAERFEHGVATIVGCAAYETLDILTSGKGADELASQRVNLISLLAMRGRAQRSHLELRLCLEVLLRGTVRAFQDEGPESIGTVGIIFDANRRAMAWAARLDGRVRLLDARSRQAKADATLNGLRDRLEMAKSSDLRDRPYAFAVANRMELIEAARCHFVGAAPYELRMEEAEVRIDYGCEDLCATQVRKLATNLVRGDPGTLDRLGLRGEHRATVWGPAPTAAMSIPVPCCPTGMACPIRVGEAA